MKKIIILAIVCFLGMLQVKAQTPSYSLWYEYGDGTFVTKSFTTTDELDLFLANSVPAVTTGGPLTAIKKVTPIYPPKGSSIEKFIVRPSEKIASLSFTNTPLPIDKNLFVHSSTTDFLTSDTIFLALSYKKTNPAAKKLAFFYNSNMNSTFKPFVNLVKTMNAGVENSAESMDLNQLRIHNNEIPSVAMRNIMNQVGQGYRNGLVFDIPTTLNEEKNIFLSLETLPTILTGQNESFKLVFLDDANTELESQNNDLLNHSALRSHDPNYEKVFPECLIFPKDGGTILHYDVHFQNTGLGPAQKVETTTTLPNGYSINDIQDLNNLNWEIAKLKKNNGYTIDVTASHDDKLVIRFAKKPSSKLILKGTLGLANPLNDVTTMGDFSFNLKVEQPLSGPQNLSSSTSIVFDENETVITNDATVRVRKCCACEEKKKKGNSKETKSCKSRSKFLQWLLCEGC
jgi:hypothetical protein